MKRSNQKLITQKARILRNIRVSRGISQGEAAQRCGLSKATVNHYENGRMNVSEERLACFLKVYDYTQQEFEEYMNGKEIPITSVKEECFHLLGKLDTENLRAIHTVLIGLVRA